MSHLGFGIWDLGIGKAVPAMLRGCFSPRSLGPCARPDAHKGLHYAALAVLLLLTGPAQAIPQWTSPNHYRILFAVNHRGITRGNSPASVSINFATYLANNPAHAADFARLPGHLGARVFLLVLAPVIGLLSALTLGLLTLVLSHFASAWAASRSARPHP